MAHVSEPASRHRFRSRLASARVSSGRLRCMPGTLDADRVCAPTPFSAMTFLDCHSSGGAAVSYRVWSVDVSKCRFFDIPFPSRPGRSAEDRAQMAKRQRPSQNVLIGIRCVRSFGVGERTHCKTILAI